MNLTFASVERLAARPAASAGVARDLAGEHAAGSKYLRKAP
jgi:hypothetical protein